MKLRSVSKRGAATILACAAAVLSLAAVAVAGISKPAAKDPIVIGAVLAQTGLFSQYDIANTAGVKLAVADINRAGGVAGQQVKLIVGDYKSTPSLGSVVAKDLISKGAKLVITSADFDFGSPAALAAQSKGVLAMSAGAEAPAFGVQGIGPLAFTMGTATANTAAVWAEWMYKNGKRRPYLLNDPTLAYDTTLCSYFKQRWTQLGGKSSIAGEDSFKNSDPSISVQITRFKASKTKPDFIVLCSYPPGGATALRQIRAAGINVPVIGGDAFGGTAWLKAVPNLSNFLYTDYGSIFGDDPSAKINKTVAAARKIASQPSAIVGVLISAYSAVQGWAEAVKRAKTTDGKAVAKALEGFKNVPLLVGPTSFSPQLHINARRPLAIIQIKNGKGHFVTHYKPKAVPPIKF